MGYENEIWTTSGGGMDQRLVTVMCQEMMKIFKGKGGDNGISRDHASTLHAGILSCCTASFALFCHPHMNIKEDWIKDTGASDHMTPNFDLFISITHLKKPIIVHLPDGNSKTVTIMGKVQLTPYLILTNVFYVPKFQLNLLSVGQLSQNHNLSAHFYSNDCCFQDPSTKKIVAVRKGSKCLYICKPTLDHVAFAAIISEFQASHLNCISSVSFHKESLSNTVSKTVLDVNIIHARLGHTSVSKLQPKVVRSDNGTEVVNKTCASFFQAHGVLHQRSIAHNPQQNGRVERKHRHLLDTARALRLHVKVLDWPHKDKFANRGIKSVLIGYPVNQKSYKLYNWETKEVFLSRDVVFKETIFPFQRS
ncbi:pyridoxal 5'-phosphate synthase-like subunit PDX1.2 [Tanacetum coccineum]